MFATDIFCHSGCVSCIKLIWSYTQKNRFDVDQVVDDRRDAALVVSVYSVWRKHQLLYQACLPTTHEVLFLCVYKHKVTITNINIFGCKN